MHRSLIRHSKIIHSSDSNDRNGCGSSAATDTVDVVGGRGEKRCYTSSHNEGINGLSANIPRTTLSIPVPSPLPSTPTTVAVTVNLSSPSSSTLPLSSPSAQSLASSPSPRVLGFAGSSNSDSQPSPPTRNKGLRVLQHTESDNETAHSTHTHALTSHSATKNIKMNNKSNKTNSNRNNRKSNSNHITTINSSTNFQRVFAQGNGSDPDAAVRSAQAFLERKKQDQSSSQPISPASITHLHNSTANNLTGEGISGNPGGCASNPASPSSGYLSHSPRSRPAPRCSSPRDYSNMSWHTGGSGDVTGSGDRRHATWATENQGNGSGHNIGRNRYYLRARGKGSTDPARGKRNIIQDQDKIRNKSGVFENITKRGRAPASVHRGGSGTEEQKGRGASLHRQLQHKSEKRKERRKAPSTNEANHDKDKTLKVETKSSPQPVVSGAGAKVEAEASAEAEAESKAEARVGDADMKLIKNVSFTLIPSGVSDLSSFPLLRYTASTHPHP